MKGTGLSISFISHSNLGYIVTYSVGVLAYESGFQLHDYDRASRYNLTTDTFITF